MGAVLTIFSKRTRDCRVLLVGLDDAGKTTLVKQLGMQKLYSKAQVKLSAEEEEVDITETVPTIGFNVKEIQFKKAKFAIWDLGGQRGIRDLWEHYFEGTDGIIYVVDSSNQTRIREAKDELHKLVKNDSLKDAVILVLANKCDLPNSMSTTEVIAKLELEETVGETRPWFVQGISALKGTGINDALEWFAARIK